MDHGKWSVLIKTLTQAIWAAQKEAKKTERKGDNPYINFRRNSNGSISCQSSVISSSLDVSLEECVISADNITDTDSGFHQTQRGNLTTSSPRATSDEEKSSVSPDQKKMAKRRNSDKSIQQQIRNQADSDSS